MLHTQNIFTLKTLHNIQCKSIKYKFIQIKASKLNLNTINNLNLYHYLTNKNILVILK